MNQQIRAECGSIYLSAVAQRQITIEAPDNGADRWENAHRISTRVENELGRYTDATVGKIHGER